MAKDRPHPGPTLSLPLEVGQLILAALHRHQTALTKLQQVVEHGDCLAFSEFDDAFVHMKADRTLRSDLAFAIAQVPHDG